MTDYNEYQIDQDFTTHSGMTSSVHSFDADGKVVPQAHGSAKHSGNIGAEGSITFANTGGHAHTGDDSKAVAWNNISGRPTLVSQFSNDLGFKTGYCTYCGGYCTYCDYCSYCTYCDCDCVCGK